MKFRDYNDLDEASKPAPLKLPIGGREYTVPPIGVADYLRLKASAEAGSDEPGIPDSEMYPMLFGPAFDQMKADGVPMSALVHASMTVIADVLYGRRVAELSWNAEPPADLPRPAPAKKPTPRKAAAKAPVKASARAAKR